MKWYFGGTDDCDELQRGAWSNELLKFCSRREWVRTSFDGPDETPTEYH